MESNKEEAERSCARQAQLLRDQEVAHQENSRRVEEKMRQESTAQLKHFEETSTKRQEEQSRLLAEGFQQQAAALNTHIAQLNQQMASMQAAMNSGGGRRKRWYECTIS